MFFFKHETVIGENHTLTSFKFVLINKYGASDYPASSYSRIPSLFQLPFK